MNGSVLLLFLAMLAVAWIAWRRRAWGITLGFGIMALLPALTLVKTTHPLLLIGAAAVVGWLWWARRGRTSAVVTRWGSAARRKSGVASSTDIIRRRGKVAMRRRAPTLRPSLAVAGRWARVRQLATLPVTEVAVELCRTGGQRVWAAIEEVVVVIGGPRKGKSQWLVGRIIDAVGAVIVTSTRFDLLDQSRVLREQTGPVLVFNAVGLGDRPSTMTFDPLTGCTDPVTAAERATDMLAGSGYGYRGASGERDFWDDQGRRNLAALMHAAALGGLSMDTVQDWLANLDSCQTEITRLLRDESPEQGFVASVTQFIETNAKTRTSITSTIAPALAWLTHQPARAAAGLPVADEPRERRVPLDVGRLLAQRWSVFMVGGEEAQVAPLVCAVTGYIAREARRLAAFCPGGRLDPPLSFRLDEAGLVCPVPLHHWTADMGGRGVSIVACFQGRAQVIDTYGDAKAATIINNAGVKVLYGGTGDRDDLNYWSTLAGDRDESVKTIDAYGKTISRTVRRVPVLAPSQIATLPDHRVVVFTHNMAPVIGWAERAYRRPDVRAIQTPDAWRVRGRAAVVRLGLVTRRWAKVAATAIHIATSTAWTATRRWVARRLAPVVAPVRRSWAAAVQLWTGQPAPVRDDVEATVPEMKPVAWLSERRPQ